MKILFWGSTRSNLGPAQANKNLIKELTANYCIIKSKNKYLELVEGIWKLLFCDCVVVSGVSRKGALLVGFSRIFGKKSIYIMHGCAEYERQLNKDECSWQGLAQERYLLKQSTSLLPVSKKFMYWVRERYPQYAYKAGYLYNGINKDLRPRNIMTAKQPNSIIAAGGNRIQKANDVLADVVESMNGTVSLEIYGDLYDPAPDAHYRSVTYMGSVPHDQFTERMAQSELFVLNSVFETFSLAVVEALMCGCSILVSEVAGVTDILALEETDMIHNPMDTEEIKHKIRYLLEYPNNERILSNLNLEEYSCSKQAERLEKLCRDLVEKNLYPGENE